MSCTERCLFLIWSTGHTPHSLIDSNQFISIYVTIKYLVLNFNVHNSEAEITLVVFYLIIDNIKPPFHQMICDRFNELSPSLNSCCDTVCYVLTIFIYRCNGILLETNLINFLFSTYFRFSLLATT